jgi:hypothetical protein
MPTPNPHQDSGGDNVLANRGLSKNGSLASRSYTERSIAAFGIAGIIVSIATLVSALLH